MGHWAVSVAIFLLDSDSTLSDDARNGLVRIIPVFVALQVLGGSAIGLYRRRWRYYLLSP